MKNKDKNPLPDFTSDTLFRAFFKSNINELKLLLQHFLPLPDNAVIESVSLLDSDQLPTQVESKSEFPKKSILDLIASVDYKIKGNKSSQNVIVEMQTTNERFFAPRMLAYLCRRYSNQIKVGGDFRDAVHTVLIAFVTKGASISGLKGISDYYHRFEFLRVKQPHIRFCEAKGQSIVLVELNKFTKSFDELLDSREKLCYLLKNSGRMSKVEFDDFIVKGGVMGEMVGKMKKFAEGEVAEWLEFAEMKRRSQMSSMLEEGKEQGREQGVRDMVLNMLKKNADLDFISEVSGLSKEEIEKIKNSH